MAFHRTNSRDSVVNDNILPMTVLISHKLNDRLRALAERENVTKSDIVRAILTLHFKRKAKAEPVAPEVLLREDD